MCVYNFLRGEGLQEPCIASMTTAVTWHYSFQNCHSSNVKSRMPRTSATSYIYIYIYISVSKRFLHCPSPRLHCFLSSHWPSFEPLSRFFSMCVFFLGDGGSGPSTQPPTWRTSVSLFVWVLSFDLSSNGGRTSSYATADIAFWIIAPCKPPYLAKDAFVKVEILQGGHPMYLNKL